MVNYSLLLTDDGIGLEKRIDFLGVDASSALSVLSNEVEGRRAELWQEDHFICTLQRDGSGRGFWRINSGK